MEMLHLEQKWDMFSPHPAHTQGWLVLPATLSDGRAVDLWHNGAEISCALRPAARCSRSAPRPSPEVVFFVRWLYSLLSQLQSPPPVSRRSRSSGLCCVVSGDKPDDVVATMPNWRWRKLMSIAWFKMFAFLQNDMAVGLCKQWYAHHPEAYVVNLKVWYMEQRVATPWNGGESALQPHLMWEGNCSWW